MFHFLKYRESQAMHQEDESKPKLAKPFCGLVLPVMFFRNKYSEYKKLKREKRQQSITDKELKKMNNKIVSEVSIFVSKKFVFCF